jgi:Ion channel
MSEMWIIYPPIAIATFVVTLLLLRRGHVRAGSVTFAIASGTLPWLHFALFPTIPYDLGQVVGYLLIVMYMLAVGVFVLDPVIWRSSVGPLFIVGLLSFLVATFAQVDWAASNDVAGCFNQRLTKIGATYFATTTFATVGFGDVYPTSDACRLVS